MKNSFLLIVIVGLALAAQPASSQVIRMSYTSRSLNFLPAFVAMEEGFFKREGLSVELIQMRSNLGVMALINNQVDFTLSYGGTLEAALKGWPIKILVVISDTPHHLVAGKSYRKVQDLKGKIIGVNRLGGSNEYVIAKVMDHFGIKRDDIKILALGDEPVRRVAIEQELIAATILSPPEPVLARRSGLNVLLWVGEVVFSPQSALATTKEKLERKRDEVKAVVRAMVRGLDFVKKPENKARVSAFISRYLAIRKEDAAESLDLMLPALVRDGILEDSKVKMSIEETASRIKLKELPQHEEIFDFSLVREVLTR